MRDPFPVRLGGIAANLARVATFSTNQENGKAVEGMLNESKYFIEWTAPEAEIDVAAKLVELQVQIALWQLSWDEIWGNAEEKSEMAEKSRRWSEQLLEMSGLVNK